MLPCPPSIFTWILRIELRPISLKASTFLLSRPCRTLYHLGMLHSWKESPHPLSFAAPTSQLLKSTDLSFPTPQIHLLLADYGSLSHLRSGASSSESVPCTWDSAGYASFKVARKQHGAIRACTIIYAFSSWQALGISCQSQRIKLLSVPVLVYTVFFGGGGTYFRFS